jgi:hypothetical protein
MDDQYEYLNHQLSIKGFKDNDCFFLKESDVRNSCTPSPLRYALTKNPVGSGTIM